MKTAERKIKKLIKKSSPLSLAVVGLEALIDEATEYPMPHRSKTYLKTRLKELNKRNKGKQK